jgi:hypothetical protein
MEAFHMNVNTQDGRSHLFLVRLRAEQIGQTLQPENREWYGRIQRVVTGEAYDFQGWAELIRRLGAMLDVDDPQAGKGVG